MSRTLTIFSLVVAFLISDLAFSQPSDRRITKPEYIEMYKEDAIREMLTSGVPASITMAQGILESDCGNSPLARYANNHFGIKCHKAWTGPSFIQDDDEEDECFRKYYSAYESYRDHSDFLMTRSRYDFLFELKSTDYKGWAKGLKKAGYATNPKYPALLIKIIEENKLYELDRNKKMPTSKPKSAIIEKERTLASNNFRKIDVHDNGIKYVVVKSGDTPYKLAKEFDLGLWQIPKYNDLKKGGKLHPGDIIYLQPKKRNAKESMHVVKKGESMWMISQKYGVKLKLLYRKNGIPKGTQPNPGQQLSLKKKVK